MINGAKSRTDERTDDLYEGTRKTVARDSNCFFAVIARAVGLTPEQVREMITTWLKANTVFIAAECIARATSPQRRAPLFRLACSGNGGHL